MYISLNEIKSSELRENILKCEDEILKFNEIVGRYIKNNISEHPLMPVETYHSRAYLLSRKYMSRIIIKEDSFEYVGNIHHEAIRYDVMWAFDFIHREAPRVAKVDLNEHLAEHILYFIFSQSEILPMHKASDSRFFKMCIAGLSYSETGIVEKHHQEIAHNNNNYPLTSILNPKSATRTVQVINQVLDEYNLVSAIQKEF